MTAKQGSWWLLAREPASAVQAEAEAEEVETGVSPAPREYRFGFLRQQASAPPRALQLLRRATCGMRCLPWSGPPDGPLSCRIQKVCVCVCVCLLFTLFTLSTLFIDGPSRLHECMHVETG